VDRESTIDLSALKVPLDGVRVITWASTQAGPFAFQLDHISLE
jgi:crotonobetainyl-CoA:carnitine CoA-transferase CaiB-like acyl-CoA transferase